MKRSALFAFVLPIVAFAAPPADVVSALESLRDQRSYSWEVINGDPGMVAQNVQTRRGTVTTLQQSTSPNIKGSVDLAGDTLLRREWPEGLRLDTLITASGDTLTLTPEGWMTEKEILTAQADERVRDSGVTDRTIWLRRADRPDTRRPDQELIGLLKINPPFETVSTDSYLTRFRVGADGQSASTDDSSGYAVTIKLNLRSGMIRDYEVSVEGTRAVTRSRIKVPVTEHRIVILTYVPIRRVDVPSEARAKLASASRPTR